MATVYIDRDSHLQWDGAMRALPVTTLQERLYEYPVQRLIPFLGAGASLTRSDGASSPAPPRQPDKPTLDRLCQDFDIEDPKARRFLEIAIELAQVLAQQHAGERQDDPQYAPSSWELARTFAEMLQLEPFRPAGDMLKNVLQEPFDRGDYADVVRQVADVMGFSRAIPQLLTVASYFNDGLNRGLLRNALRERFTDVTQATPIQRRIVHAAKQFVTKKNADPESDGRDYVIITTNYDPLLEQSLKSAEVPTCVVTVNLKNKEVIAEVLEHTQHALKLPDDKFAELQRMYREEDTGVFSDVLAAAATVSRSVRFKRRTTKSFALPNKVHSLAMVFKIHGDPSLAVQPPVDNVVISDQDYVRFIQVNGSDNQLVPAYISSRMSESSLLFLGYSFSDWNVRSLYRSFVKKRDDEQHRPRVRPADDDSPDLDEIPRNRDFIVMRSFEAGDVYFLNQWDVSVVVTELDKLADLLTPRE